MYHINHKLKVLAIVVVLFSQSCRKFLDVPLDRALIESEDIFSDENNAVAAVNGLYHTFTASPFGGGGSDGTSLLTGLSADEINIIQKTPYYLKFEENALLADDPYILRWWNDAYMIIYQANDIIESTGKSTALTGPVKDQILGEALFIRAFTYFYLSNMFGDVPLILGTDYQANSLTPRTDVKIVTNQVIDDLKKAREGISETYPKNSKRSRVNRAAVTALLARVALYTKEWATAETYATEVINTPDYAINGNLDGIFKLTSTETIWQLASEANTNTRESLAFMIEWGLGTASVSLTSTLLNAFAANDQRREKWVAGWYEEAADSTFYYPYKYKATYYSTTSEFLVVMRLAEQYLIRAEARANLEDLDGAIADLDVIRERAGLQKISEINSDASQDEILSYILQERRIELFTEWGHRWFDLKRRGVAVDTLSPHKTDFSSNDLLYPIPHVEFERNPKLGKQNNGY